MSESRAEQNQRHKRDFRADDNSWRVQRKRIQTDCPHLDALQNPNIGLQHNFPDRLVRGICLRCHDVMHPRHWEIAAPTPSAPTGRLVLMQDHPFYPVVLLVDAADAARAILNDVADAAINSLMASSEVRLLGDLEQVIDQARWAIQEELRCNVATWRAKEAK
jgi:hypothetical protein